MRNTKRQNAPPRVPILRKEILELAERGELLISGVLGIEGYSPCHVRIRTARGIICISGQCIGLCWAGEKRLMLRGKIENIGFL